MPDPNPIIDEGNPTSTAGYSSIVKLCDVLNREVELDEPKALYQRGWGPAASDAASVIAAWRLHMQDVNRKPVVIVFDVTNDNSPIVIGMDIKRFTTTNNLSKPTFMYMRRPGDRGSRCLQTYLSGDGPLTTRLRLLVAPTGLSLALMGGARKPEPIRPMTLAKRIHSMTHAHPLQAIRICRDAGWLSPELVRAIKEVSRACPSCAISGPPGPSKKISINHVNEHFNEEVQADYTYLNIDGKTYTALHVADVGTGYSEIKIVKSRRADQLVNDIDLVWIYKHGTPKTLSADDEFNREPIREALKKRVIHFRPRPTRRHNKCGVIERKNGTVKRLLEKLDKADKGGDAEVLVAKACFFANSLYGSKILSAFELARGYTPSVVGNPSRRVPTEILEAHTQQMAVRALNKLLRSKNTNLLNQSDIKIHDDIVYFYNSSKGTEKAEWRSGKIHSIHDNLVEVSTGKKGQTPE